MGNGDTGKGGRREGGNNFQVGFGLLPIGPCGLMVNIHVHFFRMVNIKGGFNSKIVNQAVGAAAEVAKMEDVRNQRI